MGEPAFLRCLRDMLADPCEVDILCGGRVIYCGERPIARRTVHRLLRCLAIEYAGEEKTERYIVKADIARQILDRPALADEIFAAVMRGQPFDVQGGKIVSAGALP